MKSRWIEMDKTFLYDYYEFSKLVHDISYRDVTYKHERRALDLKTFKELVGEFGVSVDEPEENIMAILKGEKIPSFLIEFIAGFLNSGFYENATYDDAVLSRFSIDDFKKLIRFILTCSEEDAINCYDDASTYNEYSHSEYGDEREELLELLGLDCSNNPNFDYTTRKKFFHETYVFISVLMGAAYNLDDGRKNLIFKKRFGRV